MLFRTGKLSSQTKNVTHAKTINLFVSSLEQIVLVSSKKLKMLLECKHSVSITKSTSLSYHLIHLVVFRSWWALFLVQESQAYTWYRLSIKAHCSGAVLGPRSRRLQNCRLRFRTSSDVERWSWWEIILRWSNKLILNDWTARYPLGEIRSLVKIKKLGFSS